MADAVPGSTNVIGFTAETLQHLLLDAGAVFSNYGTATEARMGATQGGSEFDVTPKTRDIAIDGVKNVIKGGTQMSSCDITMKINFLEVTVAVIKAALMANVDTTTNVGYTTITGKSVITADDYIDNIALVSTLSANSKPIIIILYNALSADGIKFASKDNSDNLFATTFTAHTDPDTPTVLPFEIRYPDVTMV